MFRGPREVERAAHADRGRGRRPPRDGRSHVAHRDGPVVRPDWTAGHRSAEGREPVPLPRPQGDVTSASAQPACGGGTFIGCTAVLSLAQIMGFRYTGIRGRDLDPSIAFYTTGLGMPVTLLRQNAETRR